MLSWSWSLRSNSKRSTPRYNLFSSLLSSHPPRPCATWGSISTLTPPWGPKSQKPCRPVLQLFDRSAASVDLCFCRWPHHSSCRVSISAVRRWLVYVDICWTGCSQCSTPLHDWSLWRGSSIRWRHFCEIFTGYCDVYVGGKVRVSEFYDIFRFTTLWIKINFVL